MVRRVFNAVATAVVIGSSFVVANPPEVKALGSHARCSLNQDSAPLPLIWANVDVLVASKAC